MIKGVIFDMDGLMIDTEKLYVRFWCQAAREFGFPMELEHALGVRSMSGQYAALELKKIFGDTFDYYKIKSRRIELMNAYLAEHPVEKKKGLDSLLEYLNRKEIKKAVATTSDMERAEKYLKQIGIWEEFDVVICGPMVAHGKPEPDIYLKAAQGLGLPPEECMALEDSPNGILAAYRAGCQAVMVPDLDEPSQQTKALLCGQAKDLEEVCSLIEAL